MGTSPYDNTQIEPDDAQMTLPKSVSPEILPSLMQHESRAITPAKPLVQIVAGIMIIVLIVGFTVLLAHKNGSHSPAIGTTPLTTTPATTILATTTAGTTLNGTPEPNGNPNPPTPNGSSTPLPGSTAQGTPPPNLPYASAATVSVLTTTKTFGTEFTGDGIDVLIDPSGTIRVATDGTGQVAGSIKTFQVHPDDVAQITNITRPADYVNGNYVVPNDCAAQAFDVNLAHENATFAIAQAIDRYRSSNSDAQLFYDYGSTYIKTTFDEATVTCTPAAGYQQTTPFNIGFSMQASAPIPMFSAASLVNFRRQQAAAKAPANFVVGSIEYCTGYIETVISATLINATCNITGIYNWNWSSQVAHTLANEIAGKDQTTAEHLLSTYPGAYILDDAEFQPFALIGGSYFPNDPSKIAFKVYPSSLNGIPTGSPITYP